MRQRALAGRAAGLNVSNLTQQALRSAHAAHRVDDWLADTAALRPVRQVTALCDGGRMCSENRIIGVIDTGEFSCPVDAAASPPQPSQSTATLHWNRQTAVAAADDRPAIRVAVEDTVEARG